MWKQKLRIQDGLHSPELTACRNAIQRIKKTLDLLEQKHHKTTAVFMAEVRSETLSVYPDHKEDYEAWKSSCESLKQWQDLENELLNNARSDKRS